MIRRLLTEGAVRASDKRARFIGEAYEAAGGTVLRDLFQGDDGGWLQDVALVDRLVAERLEREAEAIRAEGWKWIEVAPDFPYGHSFGLRQLRGEDAAADGASRRPSGRRCRPSTTGSRTSTTTAEELPEEVDRRLGEIEAALAAFDDLPGQRSTRRRSRAPAPSSASARTGGCGCERGLCPARGRAAGRGPSRRSARRLSADAAADDDRAGRRVDGDAGR